MRRLARVVNAVPQHVLVAMANGLARLVSISTQLICIPLLAINLKTDELAAYTIISSLMTWYLLLDLGVGNAAQNYVSESYALGKSRDIGKYVSMVVLAAVFIFFVAGLCVFLFSQGIGRTLLGGLKIGSPERMGDLVLISGLCFLANAVGVMSHKVLYALRKGMYANVLLMLNSLGFLLVLYFLVGRLDPSHKLEGSVLAYAAPPAITGFGALAFLGLRYGSWRLSDVVVALPGVAKLAMKFGSYAVLGAVVVNFDYIILSQMVPADQIVSYNLLSRIFMVALGLYGAFMLSLRPEFSAMGVSNGREQMMGYIHRYSMAGIFAVLVMGFAMYFAAPFLVEILMPGHAIYVGVMSITFFSLYIATRIFTDTYTAALQSLGAISGLLKVLALQGMISVLLQVLLAQAYGMNGILAGLILSYFSTLVWMLPKALRAYWRGRQGPASADLS